MLFDPGSRENPFVGGIDDFGQVAVRLNCIRRVGTGSFNDYRSWRSVHALRLNVERLPGGNSQILPSSSLKETR